MFLQKHCHCWKMSRCWANDACSGFYQTTYFSQATWTRHDGPQPLTTTNLDRVNPTERVTWSQRLYELQVSGPTAHTGCFCQDWGCSDKIGLLYPAFWCSAIVTGSWQQCSRCKSEATWSCYLLCGKEKGFKASADQTEQGRRQLWREHLGNILALLTLLPWHLLSKCSPESICHSIQITDTERDD